MVTRVDFTMVMSETISWIDIDELFVRWQLPWDIRDTALETEETLIELLW